MMLHTTAEANQQLASQTSKKTDQHEQGMVFCQPSRALSACSSTGREDRRWSCSGSWPSPSGLGHLPGRGLHSPPRQPAQGWATLPARSSAEARKAV